MTVTVARIAEYRMTEYLSSLGNVLGNKCRHASFMMYALGLMGEGGRKRAEPIATRACAHPALVDAFHQRLTYFLSESDWHDAPIRRAAARYALEEMTKVERVSTWIIDDTAFPKQGTHSVGVQRQDAGRGGKVANCQIGVSLAVGTPSQHLPIDFELYLPNCWTDDPARRGEGHIPANVGYQTKTELAVRMIRRAVADGVPAGVVLADSAYGDSSAFRRELRQLGLNYAVGVPGSTAVWRVDDSGKCHGRPTSAKEMAHLVGAQFRKVSWHERGTGRTWSHFASCRVRAVDCLASGADDEELWLLMEMSPGRTAPAKFWLATLPRCTRQNQLVQVVKERHRTEQIHEGLKRELGLNHFEGRTYRGWHHHVTVALACFAFMVAEQARCAPQCRARCGTVSIADTP